MIQRLAGRFLLVASAAVTMPGITLAQTPADFRELSSDQQILHALSRLTFGARPGDIANVRATGLDRWVEQQLHPERMDDSAMDRIASRYSILARDQNELLREFNQAQRQRRMARRADDTAQGVEPPMNGGRQRMDETAVNRRAVMSQLASARVARAVGSNRQLEEVVTDFWLNHFNVFARKGPPQVYYLAEYDRDVIRPNALGKFRDLLGAVAKSPAMLFYLDNARSMGDTSRPRLAAVNPRRQRAARGAMRQNIERLRNGGLNENYGRELLELHTLGVDGGYTQRDVIDVARALTGWTIRQPAGGGGFVFRPEMHDAAEKTVLGQRLPAGRGIEDGEQVLDIVARHPATAGHIARKLAIRFVSDDPPDELVDRAAAVFLRTDGDIREVVRTIITSNEFHASAAFRSKLKSPFEVVVSALRAMNAEPDTTPRAAQAIAFMGQPVYGHQAPDGYPETGEEWMNAGAILNRINFGIALAAGRIPGARVEAIPGIDSLRTASRETQVDVVTKILLGGIVSPETRAVLVSGENPLLARGAASPASPAAPQLTGIAQIVGLAIGSPEFQRR